MSSRCRDFVRSLNLEELKNIRVKIKRPNIPEPEDGISRIYRGLDDPKSLIIHFKKESPRGIFDREDIVLNQEFPEETSKKSSRNSRRRSSSEEESEQEGGQRNVSYHTSSASRIERERLYRGRSRSGDRRRYRSSSGSRGRSRSPSRRYKDRRKSSDVDKRGKSRSTSPRSKMRKQPGLFIPTESDYLKYKKKKLKQSRSPAEMHSSKKDEYSSRSSVERYRSPRRKSRTPSRGRNRSNSPRRSRRSRSRSRHRYREVEEVVPFGNPNMAPCIFQDGKYWVPVVGPAFVPRGYIPPPMMYPRPFIPPPMNPLFRHQRMNSFRQRLPQPRQQVVACEAASTSSTVPPEADSHEQEK